MWLLISYVTPKKTADGLLGSGGRSAQLTPRYITSCGTRLSYLLSSSSRRPETSGARPLAPLSPLSSISLLRPPYLDSSCEHLPQHLLHLLQPPARLSPGRNRPNRRWSPLEPLELCSTVDPPLRSSSARTDPGNGFVVSYLYSPAFFPFRCAPPAPENGRRRACCRRSRGVKRYKTADGPPRRAGQSVGQVRSCPETMLSLVVLQNCTADGPLLESGQSAVELEFVQRRCCLWWV